jgi:hypothetical protein
VDDRRGTDGDDAGPEIETYTEYRLSGQPPGDFPLYDLTFHDDDRVNDLRRIFERAAERGWTDVQFRKRDVTITRTPWEDARG